MIILYYDSRHAEDEELVREAHELYSAIEFRDAAVIYPSEGAGSEYRPVDQAPRVRGAEG